MWINIIYIYGYIQIYTYIYIKMYTYCVYIYRYVCKCIYMIWIYKYIYIYIQTNKKRKYIYIYVYHFFVKHDVFRQCQWDTSCRSRRELSNAIVKSDFHLTGVEIWPFPFRKGVIYGKLARGGWGNQGKRGLWEPSGTAIWSLHINNNSKSPSKQSFVRESLNIMSWESPFKTASSISIPNSCGLGLFEHHTKTC